MTKSLPLINVGLLVIANFIYSFSCLSQSKFNDLEEEKLLGKPIKVVEQIFEISGKETETKTGQAEMTFDQSGNYSSWKMENLVSGEVKTKRYDNNYGESGLLQSRSERRTYNWGSWEGGGKTEYEYDSQGKRISEKKFTVDGELRYVIKSSYSNNIVGTKSYNNLGELFESRSTTRNGNTVRYEFYKKAYGGMKPETISISTYDSKSSVTRIDYEYRNGSKNIYDQRYKTMRMTPDLYEYEYDEKNQIKKCSTYTMRNGSKKIIEITEYKYYDLQGNWTEKIQWMFKVEANGLAPSSVYKRSIGY